jgi:hypothetical protein
MFMLKIFKFVCCVLYVLSASFVVHFSCVLWNLVFISCEVFILKTRIVAGG